MANQKLDLKNKMSLHACYKKLGDPVPVEMLPKLTKTEPGRIARAIQKGVAKLSGKGYPCTSESEATVGSLDSSQHS